MVISAVLSLIILILANKYATDDRSKNKILKFFAILTVIIHYSNLWVDYFTNGGTATLENNQLLPVYPCNVVMWSAVIFAFLKNKKSRLGRFFSDYIFWFGLISTLVGMFANVDFIRNPTLADYENVKSIGAHATLLFNVLLLPVFGYIKIDVKRNMMNIIISILVMGLIGGYCNLVFSALGSPERAYDVNSMFLMHSPFDGVDFLTYPVIALLAIPIYFVVFVICDLCAHKKGARFYNKTNDQER
jgi:hypothetical protein